MNFILYAVPFFFVLIALELLADRWRGRTTIGSRTLSTWIATTAGCSLFGYWGGWRIARGR
ncbi:hypothetical protein F2A38_29635 [Pseudomonas chlororaphis]|uniref:Uncharacterized protein n=1 Tax=Pseudomonas chlororaphis TaxID=587753 RepID=A0AB34BWB7_9PSED|nr:hypothetical protein F2A38_29635 [Pseudomonas chlororaphis]